MPRTSSSLSSSSVAVRRVCCVFCKFTSKAAADEALLLCEAGTERDLRRKISADLAGQHFAATNVTDALCVLQVEGPDVRAVLAKGCALDLHPRKFTPGQCAQTMLAHAGVTIIATDENCFLLICRTSFASYTLDWLQDAALEFGFVFQG